MTQNQEEIENNFHGKRVMYGGLALLDHSLLQPFNMRYRIFCCTRPRTGSRDSHTCVANYTNHSRNICGKFKNHRGRESFSFQLRAEIKRSILARTRLKHAFFSQSPTHSATVQWSQF